MPAAPAEIMPPSVFQLQHVQHIQKAFYVCPSLSVAVVGLGVPVLQPPPCGGGYPQPCHFFGGYSGDFAIFSEFVRSSWGLFSLCSFSVRSFSHGFIHASFTLQA
jgi:hypothetical protein